MVEHRTPNRGPVFDPDSGHCVVFLSMYPLTSQSSG